MNSRLQEKGRKSVLLLNNAFINKQKNIQEVLRKIFDEVIFLLAYSPPFAYWRITFLLLKQHNKIVQGSQSKQED